MARAALLQCLTVTLAVLPGAVALEAQEPSALALAEGDECPSGVGAECALSALQRQARKVLHQRQPVAAAWQQCGGTLNGEDWTGATICEAGYSCVEDSQYYSQCKPEGSPPAPPPAPAPRKQLESEPEDEEEAKQVPLKPNPPTPEPKLVEEIHPIIIKGNFLYDSVTGKRFFAKGVAYNPRNSRYDIRNGKSLNCTPGEPKLDPLGYAADVITDELEPMWGPALVAIANLGANVVRLYNVDPANDHSKFMEAAAKLGLYVIVPLTRKDWGYLPAFPSPDCYTKYIEGYGDVGVNVLTTGKLLVKEFSRFNNTLMFTIANEMTVNDRNGFASFPCVKAYTRDIHRYQASCSANMRRVPLIYADMDIGDDRTMVGEYLTCEVESPDDVVDAYGINVYSWCDESYPDDTGKDSFQYSPYLSIRNGFKNFNAPVLFTEFGCNVGEFETHCPYSGGRTWPDVKAIVEVMGEILSGAIAFEFSMEETEFGLVLTPGFLEGQDDLYLLDNYYALQRQFSKYNVSSEWDTSAASMADCAWLPSAAATLSSKHVASKCPSVEDYEDLQERRRVDFVSNWDKLPGTPRAPLSDVNGQAECPAYDVSPHVKAEGCCHMACKNKS